MKRFKFRYDLPFLARGNIYDFDFETGEVFRVDRGVAFEHPLRSALSQYLWLLMTEKKKYFKEEKRDG
jgi:hypothetical protein